MGNPAIINPFGEASFYMSQRFVKKCSAAAAAVTAVPHMANPLCMVSVTGRDQAIYKRKICFSYRASYPSGAWFNLRCFFDGESAF